MCPIGKAGGYAPCGCARGTEPCQTAIPDGAVPVLIVASALDGCPHRVENAISIFGGALDLSGAGGGTTVYRLSYGEDLWRCRIVAEVTRCRRGAYSGDIVNCPSLDRVEITSRQRGDVIKAPVPMTTPAPSE
ncbi:hypothetical protein ES703_101767 [subsurface metagenome]